MHCSQCGQSIPAGRKFCGKCGSPAPPAAASAPIVCSNCGQPLTPGKNFCTHCGQASSPAAAAPTPAAGAPAPAPAPVSATPIARPAGFWRRFIALMVDLVLVLGILSLTSIATTWLMNREVAGTLLDPQGKRLAAILGRYETVNLVLSAVLMWLYFAGFEASRWQATPGKLVFGVRVTDREGKRMAIWRSALRALFKAFSAAPLLVGFWMAALNARRRTLHDLLSGTYAVRR